MRYILYFIDVVCIICAIIGTINNLSCPYWLLLLWIINATCAHLNLGIHESKNYYDEL